MKKLTIAAFLVAASVFLGVQIYSIATTTSLDRPSHVDDRQWHRWLMRGGEMNPQKMLLARKIVQQQVAKIKLKRDAGIQTWSEIGPNNIGGRIRAIALQPDGSGGENIFIGAAGGGVWRSLNSGASWTLNEDIAQSMAVTSIVVDPTDPDILYAATGEGQAVSTLGLPGAGIFKSVNGGDDWSQLSSTNNNEFFWVNKLAINPANGDHILAVTADLSKNGNAFPNNPFSGQGKLKESLNSGATWNDVVTLSGQILTDVEFHPNSSAIRVISGHGSLLVYNSSTKTYDEKADGDANELPANFRRIEVAISTSNFNTIYALANAGSTSPTARVYRSLDGGATWSFRGGSNDIFSSPAFGDYANTILVDPTDVNTVYLGGVDLWKSTNGGITFTKISDWTQYHTFNNLGIASDVQLHADQHILLPSLNYTSMRKKVYVGNDGGIMKTDDINTASDNISGISGWDDLVGNSLGITQFYAGAVSPHTGQFAGGTQDNGILVDTTPWTQPLTGDGHQVLFHPTNANVVYANNNYNKLYQSMNGGVTFNEVTNLGEDEALLIAPIAINPTNPNSVYLGGKRLWRFNDATGITSLLKDSLPPAGSTSTYVTVIAVDSANRSIFIGYSNGSIEFSTNGGVTWSGDITNFQQPNTAVTDIDINPHSDDGLDCLVSFGAYESDRIWALTTDGSHNWSSRPLLFDMQINTLTHHPLDADWIYAGTDVGIFASEDYGQNWSVTPIQSLGIGPEYDNDGPTYTEISDLFWKYDATNNYYNLCAATFGRGIWMSGPILEDVYVNRNNPGPYLGTRPDPYRFFLDGIMHAENTGASVIFLGAGTHPEISTPKLFERRALITSELAGGFSVVIE